MKLSLFKCLRKVSATTICESEIGKVKQEPKKASDLAGYPYKTKATTPYKSDPPLSPF